jgi:hypothetical protein
VTRAQRHVTRAAMTRNERRARRPHPLIHALTVAATITLPAAAVAVWFIAATN